MDNYEHPTTKQLRFASEPEVHEYTPPTSPRSALAALGQTHTNNATQLIPTNPVFGHGHPYVAQPPGYMFVASNGDPMTSMAGMPIGTSRNTYAGVEQGALVGTGGNTYAGTAQALPTPAIHSVLEHFPLKWDVRTTQGPRGLPVQLSSQHALGPGMSSCILRFSAPRRREFRKTVWGTQALTVGDVLKAIHEALYEPLHPGDNGVLTAALAAREHRTLRRDADQLYMVDLYPVAGGSPPELCFLGLRWSSSGRELVVHLGPAARVV
ncbi:hypothetical protein BD309DRAFT_533095 [Dichomitus squalens]|uniref:Uncharacterized protein n=1 Tax=Dichomitus squalens TaxID=114155 RepID=A0A4Q9Q1N8_9APHY|nr:hypothetical protein BD309DRAFT_533095 [Dichomitus squalens]TBU60756.1 hypothetical protein BD310DRAFT_265663 [Dichomitus squalens]